MKQITICEQYTNALINNDKDNVKTVILVYDSNDNVKKEIFLWNKRNELIGVLLCSGQKPEILQWN